MASIVQGYKFRSRRGAFRFMTEAKEIGYKWPCNEIDPEKDSQTYADKGTDMWDDGEITYTDVNRYHKDFEGRSIKDLEDSSTWVVYARFYGMETKYKLKEWEGMPTKGELQDSLSNELAVVVTMLRQNADLFLGTMEEIANYLSTEGVYYLYNGELLLEEVK